MQPGARPVRRWILDRVVYFFTTRIAFDLMVMAVCKGRLGDVARDLRSGAHANRSSEQSELRYDQADQGGKDWGCRFSLPAARPMKSHK